MYRFSQKIIASVTLPVPACDGCCRNANGRLRQRKYQFQSFCHADTHRYDHDEGLPGGHGDSCMVSRLQQAGKCCTTKASKTKASAPSSYAEFLFDKVRCNYMIDHRARTLEAVSLTTQTDPATEPTSEHRQPFPYTLIKDPKKAAVPSGPRAAAHPPPIDASGDGRALGRARQSDPPYYVPFASGPW